MDDEFTLLAVPVGDLPGPVEPAESPGVPPPPPAESGELADTLLLRGYDAPGDYFQPRLRTNDAA